LAKPSFTPTHLNSSLAYNSKDNFLSKGVVLNPSVNPPSAPKGRNIRSRSVSTSASSLPTAMSSLSLRLTSIGKTTTAASGLERTTSFTSEVSSPPPSSLSSPRASHSTSFSRPIFEEGKGSRYRRVMPGSMQNCSSPGCTKPKVNSKSFCATHLLTHVVPESLLQSPEHLSNMRYVLRKPPIIEAARKKIDPKKFKLFGGELSEAVIMSDLAVPQICYECIEYLRATSLKTEGLFRITGNNDKIQLLRANFEKRKETIKAEESHDVAGVLKLYLKMLASPLIPYSHYNHFLELSESKSKTDEEARKKVEHYSILCSSIPAENRGLLQYLLQFLWEVAENTETNKMDSGNLAIVFAPSLLQPKDPSPQMQMAGLAKSIACMKCLIENQWDLFSDRIIFVAE